MSAGVLVAYVYIGAGPSIVCGRCADELQANGVDASERYRFNVQDLARQDAPCCERCGDEWIPRECWWAGAVALALVVSAPGVASAHHEIALAEAVQALGFWIPVGVLALLGLIDRARFWWRDGARVSFKVGRWHVYGARGLGIQVFKF